MLSSRTSILTLLITLLALFSLTFTTALPLDLLVARDVWSPRVLTPNAEVGWIIGTQNQVTWDTSDAPQNISNAGMVYLAKGGRSLSSGPGSYLDPLARGFDLRAGFVDITVPDVEPGNDYQVVLMGDSGNLGPVFTISEAC